MYKVIYWTTRGTEITKHFESINEACNFALQVRYGLNGVFDEKEDCLYNRAEDLGNGFFVLKKKLNLYDKERKKGKTGNDSPSLLFFFLRSERNFPRHRAKF